MAVVVTAKTNGVNNNLGLNGTVTANGLTTGGNSWVLVYASVGNVGTNSVASVTINGVSASKICSSLVVDGTSVVEWWGLFSVAALTAVNVSVVFNNPAGAGINVITHEATGTDANSIGNVSPTSNGTSGTSSATVLCSFALSVMVGGSLTFGGSETGFVNSTLLADQNDGAGDFATTAFNNQTTSAGTSYSVGITHASGGWGMSAFEVKPAGSGGSLTSFAETSAPLSRPTRAPKPENPQPLRSPVNPVLSPAAEANQPQWRVSKDPQPDNPQVQPAKTQPFARNVDMNPPVRRPDRRTAIEPYPQPLPAVALQTFTALETTQSTRSQVPSRRQLHDPQVLPNLIIPPPAITNDWAPGRRTRAPRPTDPPPLPALAVNPYAFPWIPQASGRYFINANGQPVWINGITVWAAMTMSATEQAQLIASCVASRVNLIEFGLIWRDSSTSPFGTDPRGADRAPFCNNGATLPFTTKLGGGSWVGSTVDPDYATTNSTYFAFAKAFVDACAAAGIVCLMFFSYAGADGAGGSTPADGWASEMALNQQAGGSRTFNYGAFCGTTFITCPNIWWGMGGDSGTVNRPFSGDERDAVIAMVNGILSIGGQASQLQFGAEWANDSIVDDQSDFLSGSSGPTLGSTGTVRTHYQFFGGFITLAARGYSTSPPKPCIVQEGPFYNEDSLHTGANTAASPPVRRFYCWAWTSGCTAGLNVGNGYIWPANIVASLPTRDDWRLHTSDQDRTDMANVRLLAESQRWWLLAPTPSIITGNAGSGDGTNNTGPGGSFTTTVTALTATDGSCIIIYYPPNQTGTITVDTTGLGGLYRLRYYDPTNNSYTTIGTSGFTHTPSSSTSIAQPPTNSAGDPDQFIVADLPTAAVVVVEPADSRKQGPRSPHLHQSAHALPAAQAPTIISAALVIDAAAREPRAVRLPANADPLPALILPWIDLPPGPIQARSARSELRAANFLTIPPPPFTPGGVDLPWVPGRTTRPPPPAYGDVLTPLTPVIFPWSPESAVVAWRQSRAPMPNWGEAPAALVSPWTPEAALVAWRQSRSPAPRWGEALAALVLPWAPESAIVAWRPTRAPGPSSGEALAALVFPWAPEAAVVAWRPTRAPGPSNGEATAALVFPWTPEPAAVAWRPTRAPQPAFADSLEALVFPWTPEPALVAQQRPRRGDLRQLAGEPLPAVVVATFSAWGFEPPPSWPRTRYLQRDRAVAGGEPLPGVVLASFPPWGFEPPQPGARRFRLDRSASGEPLPQLILPWADTYAPPAARAQRPDRGAGATGPQPFLSLPPIAEQVVAAARVQRTRAGWASDALGAPILPSLGGWDVSSAIARPAARPLVIAPDAAPPLVIAVHGFVYAETSAQRRREKVWTTIDRPVLFVPPPVFPWGYEAVSPIVRYGLRTGLPYLALVLPAALPPPVPPTFPLPPPFVVQLVDEGGPVDLRGKTVVCRTRPADHSRVTIADAALVVDAIRGLVQKTWTERDLRGVPTGDMLLQFVVTDGQARPRTYPGGGRYYHQEITGRTR